MQGRTTSLDNQMTLEKPFKRAINRTFSCKVGVLWQGEQDKQLCIFLMKATEEFCDNGNGQRKMKKAALMIGRQPNQTPSVHENIFIFNENVLGPVV